MNNFDPHDRPPERDAAHPGDPEPKESASDGPSTRKRRRRWPYVLGLLVILLVLLVGFAPYLASTGAGARLVASTISGYIQGDIQAESLSLSWRGPSEARGIRVLDPAGREVLRIKHLTWTNGLWDLITDPYRLNELNAESPRATLAYNDRGEITLVEAFRPTTPTDSEGPLPDLKGRLDLESGHIHVVPRDGAPYDIRNVDGYTMVNTLSAWDGKLRLTGPGGGVVKGEFSVRDLLDEQRIDLFKARGTFNIQTAEPVDAGALAAIARPDLGLKGSAEFDVRARFDAGEIQADVTAAARGLSTPREAGAEIRPVDLKLAGEVAGSRERMSGNLALTGEPGRLQSQFEYRRGDRPLETSFEQVVAAVLTGRTVALPDFSLAASGEMDLPRLAQAVPALLNIREGVEVTEGRLVINDLSLRGGSEPAAQGSIELTEVRARHNGRAIELEPMIAALDVVVPEAGLLIRRAELDSGFARVRGAGEASRIRLVYSADLSRFSEQMGQIIDLSGFTLAGRVSGNAELARAGNERMDYTIDLTGENLQYARDERGAQFTEARLRQEGSLFIADSRVTRLSAPDTRIELDRQAVITATGEYAFSNGGFEVDFKLAPVQVEYVAAKLEPLGISLPEGLAGRTMVQAQAAREGRDAPIQTEGRLLASDLARDGRPIGSGEAELVWSGGQYRPDGLRVDSTRLRTSFASLNVPQLVYRTGPDAGLIMELRGNAEMAELLRAIAPLAEWEQPPDLAGRMDLNGRLTTAGDLLTFTGDGTIEEFVVGAGAQAVRDPRVRFAAGLEIDQRRESLAVKQFDLTSQLARLQLAGTVDQYATTRNLNLTCAYDAQWAPLVAMLHEFAPATADLIRIAGQTSDRFEIRGPLNDPRARPSYRGVTAQPRIGWSSAEVAGLSIGGGTIAPRLADGRITIPNAAVPASGGTLTLGGVVDLAAADPLFQLPGGYQVLSNIRLSPQLSRELLSRFNPVFGGVSEIDGTASLSTQNLVLPIGGDLNRASGSGKLALSQMRIQPRGFLTELLNLATVARPAEFAQGFHTIRMSDLDFVIRSGRIHYENFTLYFLGDEFDLRFYGSVGLDGTLDLVVSVPVRAGLLERFGVAGPAIDYTRLAEGVRVDIPVSGTRLNPRLNLAQVDLRPILANLTGRAITGQAGRIIGNIANTPTQPAEALDELLPTVPLAPRPGDLGRTGEDVLRGIFGGRDSADQRPRQDERNRRSQNQQRRRR